MDPYLEQLEIGLRDCGFADQPGQGVLLGVSGGADSVAMLLGMSVLAQTGRFIPHVAHLDHGLRGRDSSDDAEWVRGLCQRLNVPVEIGVRDVSQMAQDLGQGVEEAARTARYEFLQQTASRQQITHIAVAHTADDQAETVLHHLIRGTGISGLRGMKRFRSLPSDTVLIRPLLSVTRAEVEDYLARICQDHRDDVSNTDVRFTRNRIRTILIPLLEQDFNPRTLEALRRLAAQADDLQDCMETLAQRLLEKARMASDQNLCRLKRRPFAGQPRHLIREAFSLLWRDLGWPRQRMGFEDWDRLADLMLNGGTATLPGNIQAESRERILALRRE